MGGKAKTMSQVEIKVWRTGYRWRFDVSINGEAYAKGNCANQERAAASASHYAYMELADPSFVQTTYIHDDPGAIASEPEGGLVGRRPDEVLRGPIHGTIQTIRGMCTDEADHRAIDRKLAELDDLVYGLVEDLHPREEQMTDEEDVCPECYRGWGDEKPGQCISCSVPLDGDAKHTCSPLEVCGCGHVLGSHPEPEFRCELCGCEQFSEKRSGPHQDNLGGPNGCEQDTTPFSRALAAADQMAEAIERFDRAGTLNEDVAATESLYAALSNYLKAKESNQ